MQASTWFRPGLLACAPWPNLIAGLSAANSETDSLLTATALRPPAGPEAPARCAKLRAWRPGGLGHRREGASPARCGRPRRHLDPPAGL